MVVAMPGSGTGHDELGRRCAILSSSPALRPTRLVKTGGTASRCLFHWCRRQRGRIFYGADKPVNELDPGSSITLTEAR